MSPPPTPAEPADVPRNKICEHCKRAEGCWHLEGGFDTDTDDEEILFADKEFDDTAVQAWNSVKTNPQLYNKFAEELCSAYLLARARWRKFTGRLPRGRRLARRKKFAEDPQLRDPRKASVPPRAFMCGECSSHADITCNRYTPNQEALLLQVKGT